MVATPEKVADAILLDSTERRCALAAVPESPAKAAGVTLGGKAAAGVLPTTARTCRRRGSRMMHLNETRALEPLDRTATWERVECRRRTLPEM